MGNPWFWLGLLRVAWIGPPSLNLWTTHTKCLPTNFRCSQCLELRLGFTSASFTLRTHILTDSIQLLQSLYDKQQLCYSLWQKIKLLAEVDKRLQNSATKDWLNHVNLPPKAKVVVFVWTVTVARPYQHTHVHFNLLVVDIWSAENLYEQSKLCISAIHMVRSTIRGADSLE